MEETQEHKDQLTEEIKKQIAIEQSKNPEKVVFEDDDIRITSKANCFRCHGKGMANAGFGSRRSKGCKCLRKHYKKPMKVVKDARGKDCLVPA